MTVADVAELRLVAAAQPPTATDREVLDKILGLAEKLVAEQAEIRAHTNDLRASLLAIRGQIDTCVAAAHAAVNAVSELRVAVDNLRSELEQTRTTALAARVDAEIAARAAASAAELLAEQQREHRRERPTDPDLRRFESDAPPHA